MKNVLYDKRSPRSFYFKVISTDATRCENNVSPLPEVTINSAFCYQRFWQFGITKSLFDPRQETVKMQQILDERMDAIHTQTRQSEPLREKLSFIEKFIVKLERNKDHFHAKMKEYQKTVEDMKTILAKKQALL